MIAPAKETPDRDLDLLLRQRLAASEAVAEVAAVSYLLAKVQMMNDGLMHAKNTKGPLTPRVAFSTA